MMQSEEPWQSSVDLWAGRFLCFEIIGNSELSKLVAIPLYASMSITVLESDYEIFSNIKLRTEKNGEFEEEIQRRGEFWPEKIAVMGAPGVLRDFRVAPLIVHPVRYNSEKMELLVYKKILLNSHTQLP